MKHPGFPMHDILAAIEAQPAPPCEQFNCPRQRSCAQNGWACQAFVEYANARTKIRKPDFSDPAERPNAENFYVKLGMKLLPRAQDKPRGTRAA